VNSLSLNFKAARLLIVRNGIQTDFISLNPLKFYSRLVYRNQTERKSIHQVQGRLIKPCYRSIGAFDEISYSRGRPSRDGRPSWTGDVSLPLSLPLAQTISSPLSPSCTDDAFSYFRKLFPSCRTLAGVQRTNLIYSWSRNVDLPTLACIPGVCSNGPAAQNRARVVILVFDYPKRYPCDDIHG